MAQLGLTVSPSQTQAPTATITHVASASDRSNAVEIGLGVAFGVTLVLAAASLMWLYIKTRRQIRDLQERLSNEHRSGRGVGPKPHAIRELGNGKFSSLELQSNTRSELPS